MNEIHKTLNENKPALGLTFAKIKGIKSNRDFSHSSKVGGVESRRAFLPIPTFLLLLQTHTHVPQTREKKRGNKVYVLPHQAGSLFLLSYPQREGGERKTLLAVFSLCVCVTFLLSPPAPSKKGNRKSSILHSCQISRKLPPLPSPCNRLDKANDLFPSLFRRATFVHVSLVGGNEATNF